MTENLPFLRDLKRCRRQDYVEAAKEVFATVMLAILPIWLGAVVLMLVPHASVAHYVGELLSSGDILLISAALVGPIVYIITKKIRGTAQESYNSFSSGLAVSSRLAGYMHDDHRNIRSAANLCAISPWQLQRSVVRRGLDAEIFGNSPVSGDRMFVRGHRV